MTLLVICVACERNYDASGRCIGSRFHCHCGEVVTVSEPAEAQGHHASVVRCSSCGGPRQGNAMACQYCQADFTLHERDLKEVCPKCLARVSERAQFCHACGHGMQAESCRALATDVNCPSCGKGHPLQSRTLHAHEQTEQRAFLECEACAGMWVSNSVMQAVVKDAKQEAIDTSFGIGALPAMTVRALDNRPPDSPLYRQCPECSHHMQRRIFAKKSGVVIDFCKEHGVWFDAEELDIILAWVRSGGLRTDVNAPRHSQTEATHDYSNPIAPRKASGTVAGTAVDILTETIGVFGTLLFGGRRP